jgi:hypothetical protein
MAFFSGEEVTMRFVFFKQGENPAVEGKGTRKAVFRAIR